MHGRDFVAVGAAAAGCRRRRRQSRLCRDHCFDVAVDGSVFVGGIWDLVSKRGRDVIYDIGMPLNTGIYRILTFTRCNIISRNLRELILPLTVLLPRRSRM